MWWGIVGALVTAPLYLVMTGSLVWTRTVFAPGLYWLEERTPISPALVGALLPHLWLFLPWWSLLGMIGLALLVGLNLALATRRTGAGGVICRTRRGSLLSLLPAAFAAPLCCGASLLALLSVPVVLRLKLAPVTVVLSLILLAANLVWLSRRSR